MYERILVPTDGSDGAAAAAEHALTLAREHDATVHALYAVHLQPSLEPNVNVVMETLEQVGADATAAVDARGEELGVEVVTALVRGAPHDAVLDYVDEHDIDLVVMGTHGRTGLARTLLGSVTERVVRQSPVPVLTVRDDE